jgi:hypothetical protein
VSTFESIRLDDFAAGGSDWDILLPDIQSNGMNPH